MDNEKLIRVRDLYKQYETAAGAVPVLKDINLAIEAGEFVAIMGPSGSGKSTFMNILGCLDMPTRGSYALNGHLGQNFHLFVNSFRFEEVKQRLADPKYRSESILTLAFDAGFKSKSAFNSFFKKMLGITPKEYIQDLA